MSNIVGGSVTSLAEHQSNQAALENYIIKLNATHSVLSLKMQEIRFDKRLPVREVKEQLAYRFGSPVEN